jgi:tungstate transport system ATP-binding protein
MSLLEVVNLEQRYGSKNALKGVSLAIQEGEILAIIGPTGAGKSTLIRVIDQLERPSSGGIHFHGQEVSRSHKLRADTRRRIGMVFQKPVVFNTSVRENVAYPLKIRHYSNKAVSEKVGLMLQKVGLEGHENQNARTLSGGETQKVALARALVTDPEVLLLDEPTANLDPVSLRQIEELIVRFNREQGTTMVMATHEMAQGQRLAHRIAVMMDSELVQVGKPTEILSTPKTIRVAQLVGVENILRGKVTLNEGGLTNIDLHGCCIEAISDSKVGDEVHICVRPEDIILSTRQPTTSARNSLSGQITGLAQSGALARVELDCTFPLVALVTKRSIEELGLQIGRTVYASFKATAIHLIATDEKV